MPQIEPINELIDRLWNEKQVSVVSNGRNCSATLSCENSIFDVSLIDQEASRAIGFIMVYRSRDNYKIENPTWGEERHPGCEEKNFVGLEVTEYYRNQGFGPLLIDIGIGIAQKDFKEKGYTPLANMRAEIEVILKKHKPKNAKFAVASVPEFLREGTGIDDTINADRVVIGSDSKKAINLLLKLHEPINGKRVVTDLASAELIKYVSNAMLATKISFSNLISFYSEKVGADVEAVLDAVGLDKRIGRIFMDPGVGYGGSCLPKDVMALIEVGKKLSIDSNFLMEVEAVNKQAKEYFLKKVIKNSPGKNLAVWGLAFKPNTDDIRFAPSIFIIENLLKEGFSIEAYDQEAIENIKKLFGEKIKYAVNPYRCLKNADALIILTEWNEFRQIDLYKVKKLLKTPYVFDGRNIYEPQVMKKLGFKYFSIGRL